MSRILSYFNPASEEHHALERFQELSGPKKAMIVILTTIAAVVSLPILCLGGVAAFRVLTEKFSADAATTKKMSASSLPETFKKCAKEKALHILREQNPDLNVVDADGNTLAHIACEREDFDEVIEELLEKGADFNQRNQQGRLPYIVYRLVHGRRHNRDLCRKMILRMNDSEYLRRELLTSREPHYLKQILEKFDQIQQPYKLDAYSDQAELFAVLLERAETDEEIENILHFYSHEGEELEGVFGENGSPIPRKVRLENAIFNSRRLSDNEKTAATEKLKKIQARHS